LDTGLVARWAHGGLRQEGRALGLGLDHLPAHAGRAGSTPGHARQSPALLDGGAKRQLTRTDDVEEYPALSPDGRFVVYASTRGDSKSSQLYVARVSDGVEQEVTHAGQNSRPVW
jgi:WD40 repeat protein